jgi:hypothetical protein
LTRQISDATDEYLRSGAFLVAVLVASLCGAAACSEKFTGINEPPSSSAGADSGGAESETGGRPEAGRGGKPGSAGTVSAAGTDSGGKGTGGSGGVIGTAGEVAEAGGGAGGSVVVDPAPVPEEGLELWLRADQGVVQAGQRVTTWKDSSSHRRNAFQSEAAWCPELASDVVGGKSAVVFDGDDDFLELAPLDADFTGGVSIFAVSLQTATGTCDGLFEASNGREIEDLHLGTWNAAPLYEVGDSYLHAADAPTVSGVPDLLTALHYPDTTVQLRRNSATLLEGEVALPPLVTRDEVLIGSSLYDVCTPWAGAIAELLVYSRAVEDEELVEIETYLQKKWGCCGE